jgi:D-alanyl-D-alanine dipeptidase
MKFFLFAVAVAFVANSRGHGAPTMSADGQVPLVEIKEVDWTIAIDLRYRGKNNITGHALYPPGTPALVRPEVARRLSAAQSVLRRYGYGLKIWDAYRPKAVQAELWRASQNNNYVANPGAGAGSLHAWGIAVDATLVDSIGRQVSMPTDFDDFTPAASWRYLGSDMNVRRNLQVLQIAMREAGFYGLRSEWWHFVVADWRSYLPPEEAKRAEEAFAAAPGKL